MLQLIPLTLGALISSITRRDCGKFVGERKKKKQVGIFSPADVFRREEKHGLFGFWSARLFIGVSLYLFSALFFRRLISSSRPGRKQKHNEVIKKWHRAAADRRPRERRD